MIFDALKGLPMKDVIRDKKTGKILAATISVSDLSPRVAALEKVREDGWKKERNPR